MEAVIPYQDKLLELLTFAQTWFLDNVLVLGNVVQVGILIGVFVFGWLIKGKLRRAIAMLHLPQQVKRFERPLKQRLWTLGRPIIELLLLWFAVFASKQLGGKYYLMEGVVSMLTAWVVIRFATSFISHAGWSRTIAMMAWSIAALNIVGLLGVTQDFLDGLAFNMGEVHISLLGIIKGGIALAVLLWLSSHGAKALERRIQLMDSLTPSARVLLGKAARFLLFTLAVFIALDSIGIDLTALAVFSGAIGLGLGFGLQKVAANLVSGVILLLDRSVKPGDVIAIDQTYGTIKTLGARYVSVVTRDGTEHLIPNEQLIAQKVENWSFSDDLLRLRVPIGISYDSDVRKAVELAVEACKGIKRVINHPEPRCLMVRFGESSVDLELRFWIQDAYNGTGSVKSDVMMRVWDLYHEHGIAFPFAQRDINIKDPVTVRVETVPTES